MPLKSLDHVNINTANLEGLVAFYGDILGLTPGPRPPFGLEGAWLYCNGQAVVHLISQDPDPSPEETVKAIDHFAFKADGLSDFLAKLDHLNMAYRTAIVPNLGLLQVFLKDPDGNKIEVSFSAEEAERWRASR